MTDVKFAFGKRKDASGWGVVSYKGEDFEEFGPYRLRREAVAAICSGEIAKLWNQKHASGVAA